MWLSFEGGRVYLRFSAIVRGSKGYETRCEIYVDGLLADLGKLDLLDVRQRDFIASRLTEQSAFIGTEWSWHRAFVLATESLRSHFAGNEDLIDAETIAYTEPPEPLIDPIVDDTINVWAGHGGSLKSVVSIMAAYQITTNIPIVGHSRQQSRNALILDYEEMTEETFGYRYRMIRQLYPRPQQASRLYYRNETMPITTTADTIRRICDEYDIGFIVIDPFINARGGAAESSADTQAAMDAVRSLRRSVLIIDHLKQDDGKGGGQDRPFGSVFTRNLARSVWTIKRADEIANRIEFTDRKANHRKKEGLVEFDVRWDKAGIGVNAMRQDGRLIMQASWGYHPPLSVMRQCAKCVRLGSVDI